MAEYSRTSLGDYIDSIGSTRPKKKETNRLGSYIDSIPTVSPTANQTKLGALGSAFLQGAGGAVADTAIGLSDVGTAIYNVFGDDSTDVDPRVQPLASGARIFKQKLREEYQPIDPKHEGFATDVAKGLGQYGTMILGGAGIGGAGKIGAAIAGSSLAGFQRMSEVGEDYDTAIKENNIEFNPIDRLVAQSIGAGTTVATQYFPIFNALNRIDKVTGGAASHVAKSVAKGTMEEAAQEMSEKVIDDLVAKKVIAFDPKRNLFYDTPEDAKALGYEGLIGGSVGGLVNLLTSSLGVRKAGKIERLTDAAKKQRDQRLAAKYPESVQPSVDPMDQAREATDPLYNKNPVTKEDFTDPSLQKVWRSIQPKVDMVNSFQSSGRAETEVGAFKEIGRAHV